MRKKGTLTREMIVAKAAELFNSKGYFRASMSDLMQATGLEKGGIYNHFGSKDELALAAFDYAVSTFGMKVKEVVDAAHGTTTKLHAFVDEFTAQVKYPPLPGGCPLLNGATESDTTNPALRDRVRIAMNRMLSMLCKIIESGETNGELKTGIDPERTARFIVSSLEGAVMLTLLFEDHSHIDGIAAELHTYIDGCSIPK